MRNQKCLNCGHENKPSDRCCTNCGSVFWDATPEERSSKKSSKNKLLGIGVAAIILVGAVILSEYGHWKDGSSTPRSVTASSEWFTVPRSTTDATAVDLRIHYYQVNKHGENVTQTEDAAGLDAVWTVNIPAY